MTYITGGKDLLILIYIIFCFLKSGGKYPQLLELAFVPANTLISSAAQVLFIINRDGMDRVEYTLKA